MSVLFFDLVVYRGVADMRAEANRSYLGILWWVIEPILYLLVFYLVFDLGLRRGGEHFAATLLTGLVVWKWFDASVRSAAMVLPENRGLMRQVYLPKLLLP
ncbi:MAG: ABC transporter permease, partial [Pseudomonadota bacterium]